MPDINVYEFLRNNLTQERLEAIVPTQAAPFSGEQQAKRVTRGFAMDAMPMALRVRRELVVLICTNDVRYADIRASFEKLSGKGETVIVGMLTAAVAPKVGSEIAAITPLVVLALLSMLRVGKNAFCANHVDSEQSK